MATVDIGTLVAALQLRDELSPALKQAASTASSGAGAISGSLQPIIAKLDEVVAAVGDADTQFDIFKKSIVGGFGSALGSKLFESLGLDRITEGLLGATGGAEKMRVGFDGLKGVVSSAGQAVSQSAKSVANLGASAAAAAAPALAVGVAIAGIAVAALAVVAVAGTLLGLFAGLASFSVSATSGLISSGSALTDLSAQTGIAVESLQTLGFAGSLVGVSMEEIASASAKMAKAITDGDAAFQQLGLSLESLRSISPEQQFIAIAERIAEIKNPTQQAAAAMDVFGKGATKLLPLIKSDLKAAADEARNLGIVMSTETATAADEVGDELTKLGAAWDGLKNNVASALVQSGALQTVLGAVKDVVGDLSKSIQNNQDTLLGFAIGFSVAADELGKFISKAKELPLISGYFESFREAGEKVRLAMATATARAALAGAGAAGGAEKPGGRVYVPPEVIAAAKKAAEQMAKDQAAAANWAREQNEQAALQSARYWIEFDQATSMLAKETAEEFQKSIDDMGEHISDVFKTQVESVLELGETFGTAQGEAEKLANSFELMSRSFGGLQNQSDAGLKKMGEQFAAIEAPSVQVRAILAEINDELEKRGKLPIVSKEEIRDTQQLMETLSGVAGLLNMIAGYAGGATAEIANLGSAAVDAAGAFKAASKEGAGFNASTVSLIGAAFQVGWALGDLFSSDDEEKWAEKVKSAALEASAALGLYVSNAVAAKIASDQLEFGISAAGAALLHLSDVAKESGTSVTELSKQTASLFAAIATGAVPAKEGIEELGELFSMLAEEADAGSVSAMAMMGQMAAAARAIGKDVPEITAAVKEAVASSVGELGGLGGIKIVNEADARAQAQIFLNVFNSVLATEGIVAAAKAIQPALKTFQEQLSAAGIGKGAADAILGPIRSAMSLLKNDMTKGGAEGAQALKTILEGQLKSGFLDTNTFAAIQEQAKTAFDQMIAGGADTGAAFQAVAPLLAQLQETARATGKALDPVTQQMIDQAKAAGVAFPVDTGTQMVDLLKELVTVMGGQLPASVQAAASSMTQISGATASAADSATNSLTQIQLAAGATSDTLGSQFTLAFDQAQEGAAAFLSSLKNIAGLQIPLDFKFGGGDLPDGFFPNVPHFAGGGWLKANPPHGRLYVGGEREDEAVIPAGLLKSLAAADQRGSGGRFVSNLTLNANNWGPRRLADEMDRVRRRNIRSSRSTD